MASRMNDTKLSPCRAMEIGNDASTHLVGFGSAPFVNPFSLLSLFAAIMNFFGGGQQQQQGPDPVFAAKTEMEVYTGS
jgi:hypothetical protein